MADGAEPAGHRRRGRDERRHRHGLRVPAGVARGEARPHRRAAGGVSRARRSSTASAWPSAPSSRNPLRASLTVLGILIGVAAVVTSPRSATGARENVAQQIQSIGSNFIIIFPQSRAGLGRARRAGQRRAPDRGRRRAPSCASRPASSAIAPACGRSGRSSTATRTGTRTSSAPPSPYFAGARLGGRRAASCGTTHDEAVKSKVVVLGATVAHEPLRQRGPRRPHGAHRPLPVPRLGVLATKGEAPFGGDQDDVRPHAHRELPRARHADAARASPACSWPRRARPRRPSARCKQIDSHPPPAPPHRRTGARARLRDPHAEGVPGDAGDHLRPADRRCSSSSRPSASSSAASAS